MTKSILSLLLIINLSAQSDKIIPSIVEHDGVVFKSNEENPYTGKVSIYWENNQIKEEGLYRDGIKSGLWKYWYKSGVLHSKGIFRNNLRTGVWIEWYELQPREERRYKNGKLEGPRRKWYSNKKMGTSYEEIFLYLCFFFLWFVIILSTYLFYKSRIE